MTLRDEDEASLDLCIVGAGFAGTVAALRARELGLRFVLLESERPLHRQRPLEDIDRADTVVLQDAANGAASNLIADARLAASSQSGIADWVAQLAELGIPLEAGARVFGIEVDEASQVFQLRVLERSSGRERRVQARAVILATGAADEEDGELEASVSPTPDWNRLIGAPALIVGDGQAAFDAVVELANTKASANDLDPVYWTPGFGEGPTPAPDADDVPEPGTGDRMLEALRRHCNIRTLAPIASLREQTEIDGRARIVAEFATPGRPDDSAHPLRLEFGVENVVRFDRAGSTKDATSDPAQRGGWPLLAELPVRVERLDDVSIPVVDRSGSLSLPGLFLIGDACGGARLVCDDFDADAGEARYVRETREATIEEAAREAVAAAEAIGGSAVGGDVDSAKHFDDSSKLEPSTWQLIAILPDGSLGAATAVDREVFEIGRRGRDLAEPEDIHMADHHASLVREDDEYYIADTGRGSGVWIRIDEQEGAMLEDEDQVWLGSQILVASREGDAWTLVHYGDDGRPRETHRVSGSEMTVGRDADVSLVRDDALLSRRHARFTLEGEFLKVYDCGARNGTFIKVNGAHPLAAGSEFRIATRGYRFEPAAG